MGHLVSTGLLYENLSLSLTYLPHNAGKRYFPEEGIYPALIWEKVIQAAPWWMSLNGSFLWQENANLPYGLSNQASGLWQTLVVLMELSLKTQMSEVRKSRATQNRVGIVLRDPISHFKYDHKPLETQMFKSRT
ncbi:hypothetical protein CDAR_431631 [Caerostris darwini]|uniref:Uncharacterized protein n=1 Tax=Caerostris darwini TaxID=1538125 RepID=A0AAV4SV87_9ARAC|nr:hypothetical protein CDAR_431631 [Caerostris darwini]